MIVVYSQSRLCFHKGLRVFQIFDLGNSLAGAGMYRLFSYRIFHSPKHI